MQTLYRLHGTGFVHQKADIPLRRSLTDHAHIDIGNGAKCLAGNLRTPPDMLSHQADQCFVILPAHIGQTLQFLCDCRQRVTELTNSARLPREADNKSRPC